MLLFCNYSVSISRSVALPRNAVGVYLSFRGSAAECSGCGSSSRAAAWLPRPSVPVDSEQAVFRVAEPHNQGYVAEPRN